MTQARHTAQRQGIRQGAESTIAGVGVLIGIILVLLVLVLPVRAT